MAQTWELSDLDLKTTPNGTRPETHWWQEQLKQGRGDRRLWFSLQLSEQCARDLCAAFAGQVPSDFDGLIKSGARMAPASHTALRFALAERGKQPADSDLMDQMLGTDILVPPEAYGALGKLIEPGILEVTDAGLALEGDLKYIKREPDEIPRSPTFQEPKLPPGPVIIAVIDDGIGIANHRFRETAVTTRIKHFLDLSSPGAQGADQAEDELLGWSWTGPQIDDLLKEYRDDEEERIYRALALIDTAIDLREPLRAAVSHGTHTLDTAAGYDWRTQDAKLKAELANRPIIAVQVPTQAGEDRSDTWMPLSLKRALDWILVKADELSADITGAKRRLPLIVNCSFGSMAGPQDGWSDVERRITQFVRTYRGSGPPELCTVVMSAGNSLQFRSAARVQIDKNTECVSIPWRVLPDDKTPSFVQIWLPSQPARTAQLVKVALRPPGQISTGSKEFSVLGKVLEWKVDDNVGAGLYHQVWKRPNDQQRESITIAIRATDNDGTSEPVVPAGLWHIDIIPTEDAKQLLAENPAKQLGKECLELDLHVHRDDVAMFARRKGRQSYFDDPDYQRVELAGGRPAADGDEPRPDRTPLVSLEGTLNAYGYGEGTVLVAGYRRSDGEPAAYSSSGAGARPRRAKGLDGNPMNGPDFAAVTEESPSLPGILATGTYSGSVMRLNGTSVAAPLAVRALADEIAKGEDHPLDTLKRSLAKRKPVKGEPAKSEPFILYSLSPKGYPPDEPPVDENPPEQPEEDPPLRVGDGRLSYKSSYPEAIDHPPEVDAVTIG